MKVVSNHSIQTSQNYFTNINTKEADSNSKETDSNKETKNQKKSQNPNELSLDEKRLVKDLQARDTEVKAHEAAHQAAGGGMTGAASFSYQQGPDGKMYAIGGEVSIATKGGSTPQEKIANARQIQAAAMAPANPSGQDFAVAASAKMMEIKAQQELVKLQQEKLDGTKSYQNTAQDNSQQIDRSNSFDISA